jgi:hypothetical protein
MSSPKIGWLMDFSTVDEYRLFQAPSTYFRTEQAIFVSSMYAPTMKHETTKGILKIPRGKETQYWSG